MLDIPSSVWFFAAWWTLLAAVPLAWGLHAHSPLRRDERVYRLTFIAAPLLLGAIWVHGLLFDVPRDLSMLRGLDALTQWFRPHPLAYYRARELDLLAVGTPGVLTSLVFAFRGRRAIEHAWNRRTAAISFGLLVGAWLLLHRLPEALLEIARDVRVRSVPALASWEAQTTAFALCLSLPIAGLGYLFARQALEARPTTA